MKDLNMIRVLYTGLKLPAFDTCTHLEIDLNNFRTQLAKFRPNVIVAVESKPDIFRQLESHYKPCILYIKSKDIDFQESVNQIWNTYKNYLHNEDLEPLASVYTPTYNSDALIDNAYNSLLNQTYTNWEWVIVDDGSTDKFYNKLLKFEQSDPRIRVLRSNFNRGVRIGYMKRLASSLCFGKYLLELDHDDWFREDCIEEVVKAFEANPEVGFVYTNDVHIDLDGNHWRYDKDEKDQTKDYFVDGAQYWKNQYRKFNWKNKEYEETIRFNFEDGWGPSPMDRHAFYLTVGPNHLRAYRKSELDRLGGYNWRVSIADDLDLYMRFYMRSKSLHIDKPLYFYLMDKTINTHQGIDKNKDIQNNVRLIREQYYDEFVSKLDRSDISAIISFCTIDYKFINTCIEEISKCVDEVILSICTTLFNGEPEREDLIEQIALDYPHVKIVRYELTKAPGQPQIQPHNEARWAGFQATSKNTDYVWFIDGDEIFEGDKMHHWIRNKDWRRYDMLSMNSYWYFRSTCFRATITERATLLCRKIFVTRDVIFNYKGRWGIVDALPKDGKFLNECSPTGTPIVHHYSWVRTKEQMLKKVAGWGHKEDKKWTSLVEEEFSRPFNGTDFVFGREYNTITPIHTFVEINLPSAELINYHNSRYKTHAMHFKNYTEYVEVQTVGRHVSWDWSAGQEKYINTQFASIDRNASILDVGCGDGTGLKHLNQLGFNNIEGIDFCLEKIKKAQQAGFKVYESDINKHAFSPTKPYDIIYASHSISHLLNPLATLQYLSTMLTSNGVLYVTLPYPNKRSTLEIDIKVMCGAEPLGLHIDDGAVTLINRLTAVGFIVTRSFDHFSEEKKRFITTFFKEREPEIWLTLKLKNNN